MRGILCILVSIGDASTFLIFGGEGGGWVWDFWESLGFGVRLELS